MGESRDVLVFDNVEWPTMTPSLSHSVITNAPIHRVTVSPCSDPLILCDLLLCDLLPHRVQISPELFAGAVASANAAKNEPAAREGGAMVRFVTRLNGKHTQKWQIAPTDTFAKVEKQTDRHTVQSASVSVLLCCVVLSCEVAGTGIVCTCRVCETHQTRPSCVCR